MPRKKRGIEPSPQSTNGDLANRLAEELRSSREAGQPVIDEQEFPSGTIRVLGIWDAWDHLRSKIAARSFSKPMNRRKGAPFAKRSL